MPGALDPTRLSGYEGQIHAQGLEVHLQERRLGQAAVRTGQCPGTVLLHGQYRQAAVEQFRLGEEAEKVIKMGMGQQHQHGSGGGPAQLADQVRQQGRLLGLATAIDQDQGAGGFNEKGIGTEATEAGDRGVDTRPTATGQGLPLMGDEGFRCHVTGKSCPVIFGKVPAVAHRLAWNGASGDPPLQVPPGSKS